MDDHNRAFLDHLNRDLVNLNKKPVNSQKPLCIECFHHKREAMYQDLNVPIFIAVRDKLRETVRRR